MIPMDRALGVVVATTLALAGVAAPAASASTSAKRDATLTITVLPGQVRLVPGEAVKVRLSTNLTTGYSWSTKVTGRAASVVVSKGLYTQPTSPAGMVGVPGTTTWRITAQSDGTARVTFLATPPGGGKPTSDGTLTVIVQ